MNTPKFSSLVLATAISAALAFFAGATFAQSTSPEQVKSDKAGMARDVERSDAAKAQLKSDKASGRMDAESKDATQVRRDKRSVAKMEQQVARDAPGSEQRKADRAALRKAKRQLRADQAKLKANKAAGKASAESKDSQAVYRTGQAVKADQKAMDAPKK